MPDARERSGSPLRCPRCGVMMREIQRRGIQLDVCEACLGTWFDRGELETFLGDTYPLASARSLAASPHDCPRCAGRLSSEQLRGSPEELYACRADGIFVGKRALTGLATGRSSAMAALASVGFGTAAAAGHPLLASPSRRAGVLDGAGGIEDVGVDLAIDAATSPVETAEIVSEMGGALGEGAVEVVSELAGELLGLVAEIFGGLAS